jgi:hypothetical protein
VHPRTEDATEEVALDEVGEAVEVCTKARAGLFGVDESHFDAFADFASEDLEKGYELFAFADVKIFEVSRDEPEKLLRRGHDLLKYGLIGFLVDDEA